MGEKNSKLPLKRTEGWGGKGVKKCVDQQNSIIYATVKSHTHIVSPNYF